MNLKSEDADVKREVKLEVTGHDQPNGLPGAYQSFYPQDPASSYEPNGLPGAYQSFYPQDPAASYELKPPTRLKNPHIKLLCVVGLLVAWKDHIKLSGTLFDMKSSAYNIDLPTHQPQSANIAKQPDMTAWNKDTGLAELPLTVFALQGVQMPSETVVKEECALRAISAQLTAVDERARHWQEIVIKLFFFARITCRRRSVFANDRTTGKTFIPSYTWQRCRSSTTHDTYIG